MKPAPVGILLAAGQGRRFGSNKLLYPVAGDTSMLLLSAAKLVEVLPASVVVINQALADDLPSLEQRGLKVVINDQADQGLGSSIACGVRASEHAAGWLIALADMPYVRTETIATLAERLQCGANIVAPQFAQQRGHPVGFSQHFKNKLLALNGDVGARDILARHKPEIDIVIGNDKGVITDIDHINDISIMRQE